MPPTTKHPEPKIERYENVIIFTFTADAVRDVENVLARELGENLGGGGGGHLLLDFTNVRALNSLELGTLVTLHKRIAAAGGRLTLFNMSPDVFRVFSVTRLDTVLSICREDELPDPNANPRGR